MLVIVLLLCILCLGHHFTSLLKQLSDLVSKFLWRSIARGAKSKINGQFCFSSMHQHKNYMTSAHIDCCIDWQLDIWQFGKPSTMFLVQKECIQYLLDCSMLEFILSIILWMVSSGMKYLYNQEFPKRFPELHHKTWVSVTYNCVGKSKASHHRYKEQMHCLSCSQCLITHLTRNENCVFGEAIHTSENCVISMREWWISGKINASWREARFWD